MNWKKSAISSTSSALRTRNTWAMPPKPNVIKWTLINQFTNRWLTREQWLKLPTGIWTPQSSRHFTPRQEVTGLNNRYRLLMKPVLSGLILPIETPRPPKHWNTSGIKETRGWTRHSSASDKCRDIWLAHFPNSIWNPRSPWNCQWFLIFRGFRAFKIQVDSSKGSFEEIKFWGEPSAYLLKHLINLNNHLEIGIWS